MSWTEERITTLKKMWEDGCSASQIAESLGEGVTRNAVIGKAHRLGLASRPSPVKGEAPAATPAPAEKEPPAKAEKPAAKAASAEPAAPAAPPAAKAEKTEKPHKDEKGEKITLLKLTERMCKWPIGHPGDADFHFCGKRSAPAQPYCPEHCSQAYQAAAPRRDRSKPSASRVR